MMWFTLTARKPAGAANEPAGTVAMEPANWRRVNVPRSRSVSILSIVSIIGSLFCAMPTSALSIYSSVAFWKANLTGESSPFLKLDRWIIMINATPLFMSIQT